MRSTARKIAGPSADLQGHTMSLSCLCRMQTHGVAWPSGRAFAKLAFGATCLPLQASILEVSLKSSLPWISHCASLSCTPIHHVGECHGPVCWVIASYSTASPTPWEILQSPAPITGLWFSDSPGQRDSFSASWAWLDRLWPSL